MHDDMPALAGIDWSTRTHAVCVIGADGSVLEEFEIGHERAGIEELRHRLRALGVERAAIERPDGPVVEMWVESGIVVVVVPSRVVKGLRSRYSLAGNKSDRSDAFMLADALRTDGHRLRALEHDSEATRALRGAVGVRKELVAHRVALVQQLGAHLERAFPGETRVFADTHSPIALRFLARFSSQVRADWLSERRLAAWLAANGYCGRKDPVVLFGRLRGAPRGFGERPSSWPWSPWHSSRSSKRSPPRSPGSSPASPRPSSPTSWCRSSRACPGRARSGPPRSWPRSAPARRGSPRPSRSPVWPAWPLHPSLRTAPRGGPPLLLGEVAEERLVRLRPGQRPGEPLGRRRLSPRQGPGDAPPTGRAGPRPGVVLRHLALLAGRDAL